MASPARTRLTRESGMKFGFTLGAAFSVLSAVLAWRQRTTPAEVAFVLGGSLVLAGLLVPTRLDPVERVWMAFGHALSRVTGPIGLGLIYYVALAPVGYLRRTFGRSPLARDLSAPTYWIPRARAEDGTAQAPDERHRALERQF